MTDTYYFNYDRRQANAPDVLELRTSGLMFVKQNQCCLTELRNKPMQVTTYNYCKRCAEYVGGKHAN